MERVFSANVLTKENHIPKHEKFTRKNMKSDKEITIYGGTSS